MVSLDLVSFICGSSSYICPRMPHVTTLIEQDQSTKHIMLSQIMTSFVLYLSAVSTSETDEHWWPKRESMRNPIKYAKSQYAERRTLWESFMFVFATCVVFWTAYSVWAKHRSAKTLSVAHRFRAFRKRKSIWIELTVLALITGLVGTKTLCGSSNACDGSTLNGDIGGIGVLLGLYLPGLLIVLSLALGHRHNVDTGANEIGKIALLSRPHLPLLTILR